MNYYCLFRLCTISRSERIGQSTVDEQTRPQTDKKYNERTDEKGGGEHRVGPKPSSVWEWLLLPGP